MGPQPPMFVDWQVPTDLLSTRQSQVDAPPPAGVVQFVEYFVPLHVASHPHIDSPFMPMPAEQMLSGAQPNIAIHVFNAWF